MTGRGTRGRLTPVTQQPLLRPFDQQQVGGGLSKVVLSFHLDEVVVVVLVDVGIKRLTLPCRCQACFKLPGLEDGPDLGDEGGEFRLVVGSLSAASR